MDAPLFMYLYIRKHMIIFFGAWGMKKKFHKPLKNNEIGGNPKNVVSKHSGSLWLTFFVVAGECVDLH